MFRSTSTLVSTSDEHAREQVVFLPLEAGVSPFELTRVATPMLDQSPKSFFDFDYDDDEEVVARPSKTLPKLAARFTKVFRRRPTQGVDAVAEVVPTVFTSPDNWRPGLLTLEQAALRADIVRRPEAFERV